MRKTAKSIAESIREKREARKLTPPFNRGDVVVFTGYRHMNDPITFRIVDKCWQPTGSKEWLFIPELDQPVADNVFAKSFCCKDYSHVDSKLLVDSRGFLGGKRFGII